jgi:hypothetical protein
MADVGCENSFRACRRFPHGGGLMTSEMEFVLRKFWNLVGRIDEVLARRYGVRVYPRIELTEEGFAYDKVEEMIYVPRSFIEGMLLDPEYYGMTEQEVLASIARSLLHEVYHFFLDMCLKQRYRHLCKIPEVRAALVERFGARPSRAIEEDLADQFAERILREEFPEYYTIIRKWKKEYRALREAFTGDHYESSPP